MTTLDDRLREAAAGVRRVEPSVPTFAQVRHRIRRRRALTAVAVSVAVAAIVAPVLVLKSGHDRVVITNPDATTIPAPTVPAPTVPAPTVPAPTAPRTATTAPSAASGSVSPARIALVAPGHAWVVTANEPPGVFRTSDNGAHWTDVTPNAKPGRAVGLAADFYARDDQDAVLAISVGGSTETGTVFHTVDGGATWRTAPIGAYESQYLSFVSPQRGFVESSRGAAAGSEPADILRTLDGGTHWQVMSRGASLDGQDPGTTGALDTGCDKTGIGFADGTTGFATGVCAISGYYFRVTHDAGRTWQGQDLPLPPGITRAEVNAGLNWEAELLPPTFDGANGAGVVVSTVVTNSDTATHHDYVYFTHDAGVRWVLTDPPLRGATWARVIDAKDWWAGDAGTLAHTSDAGAHWTTMPNTGLDLEIAPGTDDLQFATPTNGWALVGNGLGGLRVIDTADGGGTWRPVPLPKAP